MHKFRDTLFWKNYHKFSKVTDNSPTRCTVDALVYWLLFKEYNFSHILEIGVFQGMSSGLMIESTNNLKSFTGIDPQLQIDLFQNIWKDYLNKVTFFEIPGNKFTPAQQYDFILVDDDHSYENTLYHLKLAESHLAEDGILAIDDYDFSDDMKRAISVFKKTTKLVPFLQAQQTEFWHNPKNNRANFLDNLLTSTINNFVFMYNIDNDSILKVKTLNVFTNEIDFFDQVLKFYNV